MSGTQQRPRGLHARGHQLISKQDRFADDVNYCIANTEDLIVFDVERALAVMSTVRSCCESMSSSYSGLG